MTEQEWLECTEPRAMLRLLDGEESPRKLRLFAIACWRRLWRLAEERERRLGEFLEGYADGRTTPNEVEALTNEIEAARDSNLFPKWEVWRALRGACGVRMTASNAAYTVECAATATVGRAPRRPAEIVRWQVAQRPEAEAQALLLRDIFGRLLFRPVFLQRAWLTPTVVQLAQASYNERQLPEGHLDNTFFAVLADALEEAGCTNADILDHCRGPGPHVRGCWVLDFLLGKN